jgi:glycosyltransferase involved in cell wall biosynthesis
MNVLNIIHYPVFGGPHNRAVRIQNALSRRGYKTTVLLPSEQGNAAEILRSNGGIDTIIIPLHRARATFSMKTHITFFKNFWQEVVAIKEIIRNYKIDIVLICGLINIHSAVSCALSRIPVVWQITDTRTPRPFRLILLPIVKKLSDSVMLNGQGLIDIYIDKSTFNVPFFSYYPPVDTKLFHISSNIRRITKHKLGIPETEMIVGMVANLSPQKGIEHFIRAASLIYRTIPNCSFLIVGARHETHDEYNKLIEKEITTSIVPQNKLIIACEIHDVENYYPIMDVKLITSVPNSEGTTTTAMEAMACGIPVVATDVGSIREVVEHGKTGFVVPPLDHEAIAASTICLLRDHELRKKMGREARLRAVEKYDVEVCADTHVRAFEAAIAHHRKRYFTIC